MAIQYIIDLNSNDQLPEVIRKCNHNFKITNLGQRRSGTISSDVEEEITDITAAIANEQAARIQGDSDLSDRIDNIPQYTLPIASPTDLGGIKVGSNLNITQDGVLSATNGNGGDYEQLDNIPSIEDVALIDNKTFPDLGIFQIDGQGYDVPDDYTLSTVDINTLWASAQPIGT